MALAYANSLAVPFLFDDPLPREPLPYRTRPLVAASFALNRWWSGGRTWSYHVLNGLVHLGCGLLLLGILRRTLARAAPGVDARARGGLALAAALSWLVHPLQTETVTYVSQRAESLGAFFVLACVYAFARALESRRPRAWQGVALGALVLGFASKETVAVAPLLVLAYDATFAAPGIRAALRRRRGFYAGLFLTAAAAFLVFVARLLFGASTTAGFTLQEVGALEYARTQPGVILHYLRLAFWPHPLVFDYDWPIAQSLAEILPAALAVAALVAGAAWLLARRSWLGFAAAWFLVNLAPTSSFVPIRDAAFEHRTYLALAGIVVPVVLGAWHALGHAGPARRWLAPALALALVALLAAATAVRNREYGSVLSLWQTVAERAPHNERAHANVAAALLGEGRESEAVAALERALACDPGYHAAFYRLASAHLRRGEVRPAILYLERAVAAADDPAYHHALGNALATAGELERALTHHQRAVERAPEEVVYRQALAALLARRGLADEAIAEYRETLRRAPDAESAHVDLCALLLARGDAEGALVHAQRALAIPPNAAEEHHNLGQCLAAFGRTSDALAAFREACRLAPDLPEPHAAAARALCALATTGAERAEALRLAAKATELAPAPRADLLETLALAHAANGDLARAITRLEQALALPGPRRNAELRQRLETRLEEYRSRAER